MELQRELSCLSGGISGKKVNTRTIRLSTLTSQKNCLCISCILPCDKWKKHQHKEGAGQSDIRRQQRICCCDLSQFITKLWRTEHQYTSQVCCHDNRDNASNVGGIT